MARLRQRLRGHPRPRPAIEHLANAAKKESHSLSFFYEFESIAFLRTRKS